MTVASDYTSITVGDYVGLGSSSKTGVTDSIDTTIVAIPASIPSLSISRPTYTDIAATYVGISNVDTYMGTFSTIDQVAISIPASIPSLSISRPIYTDITATYAGLPSSTSSSKGATLTFSWT
jgi:hypothetical protein